MEAFIDYQKRTEQPAEFIALSIGSECCVPPGEFRVDFMKSCALPIRMLFGSDPYPFAGHILTRCGIGKRLLRIIHRANGKISSIEDTGQMNKYRVPVRRRAFYHSYRGVLMLTPYEFSRIALFAWNRNSRGDPHENRKRARYGGIKSWSKMLKISS